MTLDSEFSGSAGVAKWIGLGMGAGKMVLDACHCMVMRGSSWTQRVMDLVRPRMERRVERALIVMMGYQ